MNKIKCLLTIVSILSSLGMTASAQQSARSPTETVREFYRALHEKRFREAFALSIYKPAIDGLDDKEYADLNSEFEKMAAAIPEKFEILGEQISGDTATVFVRLSDAEASAKPEMVPLMRTSDGWIVGTKNDQQVVKDNGKDFFFTARIEAHHSDVQEMMQRISLAQIAYAAQHQGQFGDLAALISAGFVPKDIEGTETTGYHFHVTPASGGKAYAAGAEPAAYNRTGKLSYYMDQSGQLKSKDLKGKPLKP